jgi:hypothetical protein
MLPIFDGTRHSVQSHPNDKNKNVVPRPRGYPGAQVGHPGLTVADHPSYIYSRFTFLPL